MISACLIVKDEEKWIEDCLRSIESICSEIIIVDTGSQDRTKELCRKFPKVRLFDFEWISDFGAARNFSIEQATQPWILSFDADEKFSKDEANRLLQLVKSLDANASYEAVRLVRRDFVTNPSVSGFEPCRGAHPDVEQNQLGYYTERMIRVFRNREYIRWSGKLHELIDPSLKASVYESDVIFHHFGYLPEEASRKNKRNFYQTHGHQKVIERPNDWKAHYDLAIEYLEARTFEKSLALFQRASELNSTFTPIFSNWGYALMELGRLPEATRVLEQCLALDPKHHDGLLNLGVTMMRAREYPRALELLMNLVRFHPKSFSGLRNLGICFANVGEGRKSFQAFQAALQVFPDFHDARLDLGFLLLAAGKKEKALECADQVLKRQPAHPRAELLVKEAGRS